jgi:hypothetical protein
MMIALTDGGFRPMKCHNAGSFLEGKLKTTGVFASMLLRGMISGKCALNSSIN